MNDTELDSTDLGSTGLNDAGLKDAGLCATGLNETDRAILAFENEWWQRAGNKERVIHERFGFSAMQYYRHLNRLLDEPQALAHQPALVKRLQRLRDSPR